MRNFTLLSALPSLSVLSLLSILSVINLFVPKKQIFIKNFFYISFIFQVIGVFSSTSLAHQKIIKQKHWGNRAVHAQPIKRYIASQTQKNIPLVAVIDTGVDINHPELKDAIWTNPGEIGLDQWGHDKRFNNIDDDHNGFIDDVHGWNFVDNTPNVNDLHGHGTHVAGIISAKSFGIAPNVKILPIKYFSSQLSGEKNLKNTVKAIRYAIKMGVQIINYSSGGNSQSHKEFLAIQEAQKHNILFVTAAGNDGVNSDHWGYYPANYPLNNIISVAATDEKKHLLKSSNFGPQSVDISAPGKNILSILPHNRWGLLTGTSQATAYVSGLAALLYLKYSAQALAKKIKQLIVYSGDTIPSLTNKVRQQAFLNVQKALKTKVIF